MVVSTIEEACEEAADAAEGMEDDEFVAGYYFVEDTHIGTGSQCVDSEEEHCIFEFKEEPEHPWFASNVAAMAIFLETNMDVEADMDELMEKLEEKLVHTEFTREEVEIILGSFEEMPCQCRPDSDAGSGGDEGEPDSDASNGGDEGESDSDASSGGDEGEADSDASSGGNESESDSDASGGGDESESDSDSSSDGD